MILVVEVIGYFLVGLGSLGCLYFFLLALAPRRSTTPTVPALTKVASASRVIVLVPAHNEGDVIGTLLRDLRNQETRPAGVLVVAHRCQDGTEGVARSEGADVLVLAEGEGKSAALQAGLDRLALREWEAVLVLDADCRLDRQFLTRARVDASEVVQARVLLRAPDTGSGLLYEVLSRLENRIFHLGRERLGLPGFLRGTGMFLGREALERCPWRGHGLTEDRDQGFLFLRSGVVVRHDPNLMVTTAPPGRLRESWSQRRRWTSAGLFSQLLASLSTARSAAGYFGARSWELPLAVLADARTQWFLLLVFGTFFLWLSRGPYLAGLLLLAIIGSIIAASGFAWFGPRFLRAILELPQSAGVALGSGILALATRRPSSWNRGRGGREESD